MQVIGSGGKRVGGISQYYERYTVITLDSLLCIRQRQRGVKWYDRIVFNSCVESKTTIYDKKRLPDEYMNERMLYNKNKLLCTRRITKNAP